MDAAAFQAFYGRTAPALRSYLRLSCRDRTLADDLLQEAYLRLLQVRLPELGEPQLKAYLYRTAHSAMADHFRARERARRLEHRIMTPEVTMPDATEPAPTELPSDIQQVFGRLGPRQKSLLWLAYVEGFRHREIAELLGLKESSVRVLLLRARRRLADMLTKEGLCPERTR